MNKIFLFLFPLIIIAVALTTQMFTGFYEKLYINNFGWEKYLVSGALLLFDIIMIIWTIRLFNIRKKIEDIDPEKATDKKIDIYINDEIGKTVHSVNKLVDNYNEKDESLKKSIDGRDRLLPRPLYSALGVSNFSDFNIGIRKNVMGCMMSVKVIDKESLFKKTNADEAMDFLNSIFSRIFCHIKNVGGVIDDISEMDFKSLFIDSLCEPEKAIASAINMCESINEITEIDEKGGEHNDFSIGMSYNNILLGLIGDDTRVTVLSLSEDFGFAEFLKRMARKYNARILVTEEYKNAVPNFDQRYNSRFLGYFYSDKTKESIKIYDVFDGDMYNIRQKKKDTKEKFEEGIELFINKKYKESRANFVDILKFSRYDYAAMEYIELCNKQIASGNDLDIYIEEYKH